ncbi:StAR-related lipid-transfer domain-containing protein [Phytophthora infestans]|uniref:StAR-related lipid-transfer domain-containing protein n=1 Tax=Phytophthora infestans TaxID=4787 RepID=A0A833S587_PHYIN|nr:StAR-related lipid-transfer domain-containing protein [Phytophthora infestans]
MLFISYLEKRKAFHADWKNFKMRLNPMISVLCRPTTAASSASLSLHLAEPGLTSMRMLRAVMELLRSRRHEGSDRDSRVPRSSTTEHKTNPNIRAARSTFMTSVGPDETVRNAVAFLAQEDGESALIYALVHDPEFRLASALATTPSGADVNVIRALLFVFENHEDQLRKLLGLLMFREMVHTQNWNELFRANSATTALLREYTCELGGDFLSHALANVVNELWVSSDGHEVNPRYLQPQDDLHANQRRLEALAERTLDRIFSAASLFPYQVAKIYRVLELEMMRLVERDRRSNVSLPRLSAMGGSSNSLIFSDAGNNNNNSFMERTSFESVGLGALPRLSSVEESLLDEVLAQSNSSNGTSSTVSAAKEEFYMHLGGLVFLRFLCPALVVPHKMNLTPGSAAPNKQMQRTLVLLAKLMQSLANNVEYSASTESFMVPFNAFLVRNRPKLTRFYDQLCQQAQNDSRRESLVARSNTVPRISQLWASRSSSSLGIDPAIVNLTGARFMESPEASCAVLRNWMSSNLDYLAMEVADNNKFRRQQNIVVSNGCSSSGSSTPPTSATSALSNSPLKARPKRKLKTSKSSTYPVEIQEEDEEEKTNDTSSKSSQRHDVAMPVSLDELDKIMGHTSHRDSQLMKVYYAKLSQNGLQRLLHVNDVDGAEWTVYKSRGDVEVLRKTPGHFVCPSGGFASEKDRLVEMKGYVTIQSTPQRVFEYLRSLVNERSAALGSSTDDDKMTIRRVEPLDDSKAVLYREHSRLSLWPAWLVKPRDSCDLHSFVEKTGRPDTYAVLQESIPRPDVPERKGIVRMAYATGGFLIEPFVGDEEGPNPGTRLTCIVRADFKGLMPRYLAESIVYRQVLEVETIRSRVISMRRQTSSEWV